ncbi:MAG TPA: alpha/beta fold hydrolase [Casimicrobiaceae bacterium]|nr:alpha/beta fold hydrolase [Casimicrobiaceae bacterium]
MKKQTELHAVSDGGASRAATAPEMPGCIVAGAGEPIVLLHSSLSSKSQWSELAARLAARFRVIALDLSGYGDNPMPAASRPFSLDDEVRLVADRLDRLVPPDVRVHIVGHSYGGLVALRFAERCRSRVASHALYEPVAFRVLPSGDPGLAEVKRVAETVRQLVTAGLRMQAAEIFVDYWSGPGSYGRFPRPARLAIARNIGKVPFDFEAAMSWPVDPAGFRSVAVPTMLLTGDHSPAIAQQIVHHLSRSLPKRYVGRIDAGHMGPVTAPHLVNPWIEAFVDMCVERDIAPMAEPRFGPLTSYASAAD